MRTQLWPALHIRPALPSDAAELAALGERTFRDAFAADNRPEDIERYVTSTYSLDRQQRELADPAWATLVATTPDGRLSAFAQLRAGPAPNCVVGAEPIELLRFYVDRAWQGRGIAQALMAATLDAAHAHGAQTVWLGVWERNARAIRFYRKCGFEDVGSKPFLLGTDDQTDRVMARSLAKEGKEMTSAPATTDYADTGG